MEILVIWLCFAVACSVIAMQKNRSIYGWFFLGLFGGVIATVVVAVLPPLTSKQG